MGLFIISHRIECPLNGIRWVHHSMTTRTVAPSMTDYHHIGSQKDCLKNNGKKKYAFWPPIPFGIFSLLLQNFFFSTLEAMEACFIWRSSEQRPKKARSSSWRRYPWSDVVLSAYTAPALKRLIKRFTYPCTDRQGSHDQPIKESGTTPYWRSTGRGNCTKLVCWVPLFVAAKHGQYTLSKNVDWVPSTYAA